MAVTLIDDFERADGAVGADWVNNAFGGGSNVAAVLSGEFQPGSNYSDMADTVNVVVASYVNGTTVAARGKVGSILATKSSATNYFGVYIGLCVTPGASTGKGYQFGLVRVTGTASDQFIGFRYPGGGGAGTVNQAFTNIGADYAPDDLWEIQYMYSGSGSASIKLLINNVVVASITDATPLIVAGDAVYLDASGVGTGTIEQVEGGTVPTGTTPTVGDAVSLSEAAAIAVAQARAEAGALSEAVSAGAASVAVNVTEAGTFQGVSEVGAVTGQPDVTVSDSAFVTSQQGRAESGALSEAASVQGPPTTITAAETGVLGEGHQIVIVGSGGGASVAVLTPTQVFPEGTTVYLHETQRIFPLPSEPPPSAALASAIMAGGQIIFAGVAAGTTFSVWGQVAGEWRRVQIRTTEVDTGLAGPDLVPDWKRLVPA